MIPTRACDISITNNNSTKLLIENSNFFNIFIASDAAAIKFGNFGQCVFSQICACNVSCLGTGHFSIVSATADENFKNYILESSFVKIGKNATGWSVNRIYNGYVCYSNNNISHALTYKSAAFQLNCVNDNYGFVNFSNICNATASDIIVVSLSKGNYMFKYDAFSYCACNDRFIYAEIRTNSIFQYSSFVNSSSNSAFVRVNPNCSVIITQCLLKDNVGAIPSGVVNNTLEDEIILIDKFLSTAMCEADNPIKLVKLYVKVSQVICIRDSRFLYYAVFILM